MNRLSRLLIAIATAIVVSTIATACGVNDARPLINIELPANEVNPVSVSTGPASGDPVIDVVRRVRPAVVHVSTTTTQADGIGGGQTGEGTGTGFIVRADGVVVTNYHVVEGAHAIDVFTQAPNAGRYSARVIGGDASADLAILKIEAQGLPTLAFGTSKEVQLGQPVVAVGFALGLEGGPSVTTGIVSALDRVVTAEDPNFEEGQRTYRDVIQTDAAINPGNSGGPLVDLDGRVVGINTAGANTAENIGFAIAIDAAKDTITDAIANPDDPVAYLGVVSQDVTSGLVLQLDLPVDTGAYVVDVSRGGPADEAGIEGGDVIVAFNGGGVRTADQMGRMIRETSPGEQVEVEIVHPDGGRETVTAEMAVNPLP